MCNFLHWMADWCALSYQCPPTMEEVTTTTGWGKTLITFFRLSSFVDVWQKACVPTTPILRQNCMFLRVGYEEYKILWPDVNDFIVRHCIHYTHVHTFVKLWSRSVFYHMTSANDTCSCSWCSAAFLLFTIHHLWPSSSRSHKSGNSHKKVTFHQQAMMKQACDNLLLRGDMISSGSLQIGTGFFFSLRCVTCEVRGPCVHKLASS